MIKNIYYIVMALIAGMMVSCDPITESDPGISANLTRAMNQDGSIVSYSQDVTINEYVDVPSIYKQLFGPEYNSRTWVWDTTDAPNYWGNGGCLGVIQTKLSIINVLKKVIRMIPSKKDG